MALTLVSVAAVLWLLVLQVDAVSPGTLSAAHMQVPELEGRKSCVHCHGKGEVAMADACAECHEEVDQDILAGTGFHGTLGDADIRDCARCHGEHAGSDFPLVSRRSFGLAGFAQREDYDHEELDFRLQGRHAQLTCADCHTNADVVFLAQGTTRFLGLEQGCQNCHEDAHEGRIVRACAECHGQEHPFALVASFEHEAFESECAHSAVTCVQCHAPGGAHDCELLSSATAPDCARTCQACHESPHSEPFLVAADTLADVAPGQSCASCHTESLGTFAGHLETTPPALHLASGFALERPHDGLACEACHMALDGDETRFSLQVPARSADDCRVCHGDPHGGQFAESAFGVGECLTCHDRERFEPSNFGPDQHQRSDFPLVESHQAVACVRCHVPSADGSPRRFEGLDTTCSACHADAHRGFFDVFDNPEGCARCHEPTLFSEYHEEAFDHGGWTEFVLDGAHARAECEACHVPTARPDENGRTFGMVSAVFGDSPERCETCHQDVHEGRFERQSVPATIDGAEGCARCHTTETFSTPRQDTFDHERMTGYPIADFHADVECTKCHVPSAKPDAKGRTFGKAGTRCADCHIDPHVAQFAVAGVTDCARCHQDAGGLAFDHQRDSRFALDEVHAKLECAVCHVPWPLPGGGEAVRYKPLGIECADCHDPDFLERNERASKRKKSERGGFSPRGGGR